ncbi:hypothetical protein GCM10025870_27050 [Agromyces marinus]|uniref:ROK family protein n=1 Tax=Agromyces marinus TaxID=1389020 RepID=A0ABN6YDW2_9MICO|nr:hypothetical protein GCM10025870_27050 [Agromyces marinus]
MRLGIDIGGTKTAAVAVHADGGLSEQVRMPTGFGAEQVVATALETVERMARITGVETSSFSSIGIGIPGSVDSSTGRVTHAVNLGLEGLDLGARLADILGVGVRVENDVNAAALGAHHLLGADGGVRPQAMAYVNFGTGLAAGIVLGGSLLRGGAGSRARSGTSRSTRPARGARAASAGASRRSRRVRHWPRCGRARTRTPRSTCSIGRMRARPRRSPCGTGS